MRRTTIVARSLCLITKDGKKCDLLPPICAWLSKMARSSISCHQFVLHYHRWEEVRFVVSNLCAIINLLSPIYGCLSKMEEVWFVTINLCLIINDGRKYDLLPPIYGRPKWDEIRFIAINLCSIDKDGKTYDLIPPICAWLSKMGRSTIGCHQFVLDYQVWQEDRFVAANLCSIVKDGKKYDLLPPICAWWSKMGRNMIVATSLLTISEDGKKYDLLSPICARLSKMEGITFEEIRFVELVAASLGSIFNDEKPYGCARWSKVQRNMICYHQLGLDGQQWKEVWCVASNLCSIIKDGKTYGWLPPICAWLSDLLPQICAGLSNMTKRNT